MLSTSNQAYVFLFTVYAGFIIGFLYDCCRMVRKMIHAGVFVTGVLDLLFWSMIGMLSFLVIFYVNNGDVRLYTILGFVIGWILYILTLSPFVMKALNWIYRALAAMIQWLVKILLWPFRMLWKAVSRPLAFIKRNWNRWWTERRRKFLSCLKKTVKKGEDEKEF